MGRQPVHTQDYIKVYHLKEDQVLQQQVAQLAQQQAPAPVIPPAPVAPPPPPVVVPVVDRAEDGLLK